MEEGGNLESRISGEILAIKPGRREEWKMSLNWGRILTFRNGYLLKRLL